MRKIHVALLLLVLPAVLTLTNMRAVLVQKMQSNFLSFLSPVMKTVATIKETFVGFFYSQSSLSTPTQLQRRISTLSQERDRLRATVKLMQSLQEENNQLRSALAYRERSVFHLVPARVISYSASIWWSTILIDHGFQDGVELDMPVITEVGLVGKVITVGKGVSTVLLVTDENCKVAATVEGTREKGITSGHRISTSNSTLLELNFLSKDAQIESGKRVYTVGVSRGIFPPGILIGTIRCVHSRELDSQAQLEPAVDLSHLEDKDVFVIAKGTR
ncbi:Cell shape-determining protein MreC precursor [Candidatus Xiphinematobacter sp. Idaho Grape]|uniref:rod shape-determining protein MreC n=1 Tax=Candidatus Xiphinematobacter sp. Idaho Grape TaxID=1704307 RepID=UPI0007066221|nr:rod shape-determining protein MreC [Candidatus Xiphinematobacter sp. Idaho Grape]ALJ56805.1 Cell shape-determining protein MreC precursor [Candidatus Xiphinematobacter sp. Idaho Grape]